MSSRSSGPHGLLVLDKPSGITSHDLVARTRRALGTRKVGHAGTLDPMATGVMLVGVGDATRLLTYFVGADKTYEAVVRLGQATTTEDADGEITSISPTSLVDAVSLAALQKAARELTGPIEQVPSAVSAISVDGKRAYDRVRAGEEVVLQARPVTIHEFIVGDCERVETSHGTVVDVRIRVTCSSGTYVRALARDLGERVGVGAHLTELRRTSVGSFTLDEAQVMPDRDALERGDIVPELVRPEVAIARRFRTVSVTQAEAISLRHGQRIPVPAAVTPTGVAPAETMPAAGTPASTFETDHPLAVLDPQGSLIGLVEIVDGKTKTLMNMPQREEPEQ